MERKIRPLIDSPTSTPQQRWKFNTFSSSQQIEENNTTDLEKFRDHMNFYVSEQINKTNPSKENAK